MRNRYINLSMRKFILIFIFFLHGYAFAQPVDSSHFSKFDIGFSFSPDYSYRTLKTSGSDAWMKEFYDTLEVSRFGYTGGVNVAYHLNEKLLLSSGILFSDKGERTKKYAIPPVNNYYNHYYYLDIPVKATYYVLVKKIKLFLTGGFTANIFLMGKSAVASGNSGETKTVGLSSSISRIGLSFLGGFGIDCPATDRWYFKLEPLYRRSIMPTANAPVKKYFYSFGFNIGLYYRL